MAIKIAEVSNASHATVAAIFKAHAITPLVFPGHLGHRNWEVIFAISCSAGRNIDR
jgi:hypothetical protein